MTHTNTEALSDLLPCPFCGSDGKMIRPMGERLYNKDEFGKTVPPYYGEDWFRVVCGADDCFCSARAFAIESDAITAWNRRSASNTGGVEVKAYLHEPTGNVFSAKDHAILLRKWQRQFAADMTAAEIAADFTPLYTHRSSSVSAEVTVTDEMVERALRAYFPDHEYDLHTGMGDEIMAKVAHDMRAALTAALSSINGGRENG